MEKEYQGSCHCGNVAFTATLDPSTPITCNCSICRRTGAWLSFVPEGQFTLLKGEGHLKDYQFNKKTIHHLFCDTCGVRSFGWGMDPEGNKTYAVNVRCLDGVELDQVSPQAYDGASI